MLSAFLLELDASLNSYLASPDIFTFSNLTLNYDSSIKNKILASVISLERENITADSYSYEIQGNKYAQRLTPLAFNLYIVFYANFENLAYLQGLEFLSRSLSFFHANSCINTLFNGDSIKVNSKIETSNNVNHLHSNLSNLLLPNFICNFYPIYIDSETSVKFVPQVQKIEREIFYNP